jgi:L-lactate dehydrogenase complex protein LldF
MSEVVNPERLAEKFIALEEHEATHDRLVWDLRHNRDKAVAGVPEWAQLRELASQIKEHTLTHLDRYLEQFEQNATKLGAHVHWARDAGEHNHIVHDILQAHGAKSLIKSKSMLQEECGMTPYLQKRGIEVTESDLGERIQQLSHEAPSHIVVPAIHKLRTDVAELFAENLGTDAKNSDPHYLTESMRQNARPKFMSADAGMTGGNFAVAETGGFVVCTNEGNADIGASVPPLHIASIGIEKLIPRARDLGVFIRMLSRSALGSPVTQYTSHFHGPRRGGELHIVLVDNTRSDRLGSPDFWHALKCIRCGACMNTCPVYRRGSGLSYGGTYSGPIGVILDPGFDLSKYREIPFHSSLCGSCTEVCPVKIDISDQIYKWRRVIAEKKMLGFTKQVGMSALGKVMANPPLYRAGETAAETALPYTPRFLLYNSLNPWGRHREMPGAPGYTFRDWYLKNRGAK